MPHIPTGEVHAGPVTDCRESLPLTFLQLEAAMTPLLAIVSVITADTAITTSVAHFEAFLLNMSFSPLSIKNMSEF
jgi:hypothetical protein